MDTLSILDNPSRLLINVRYSSSIFSFVCLGFNKGKLLFTLGRISFTNFLYSANLFFAAATIFASVDAA